MKNYFKKFSIMFVMALAIVGFGIIQNGSVANAAELAKPLPEREAGWSRYDSNNPLIVSNTSEVSDASGIGGTYYWIQNMNDYVNFKFKGSKIRIITVNVNAGYAYPGGDANITIDGTTEKFTTISGSTVTYKVLSYEKTGLSDSIHDVTIQNPTGGHYIWFDAVDIDDTGYLVDHNTPVSSISLDNSSMNLTVNNSKQLTATTTPAGIEVTWTSSDSSIATVDSTGKVMGVSAGIATITAKTADGLKATCIVTVTNNTVPTPTELEYIVNTARAKGDNTNNASGEVSIIYKGVAEAQLSVVKTADVQSVFVGDNFTYTIVVTNTGVQTAKAVVINDVAPNHIGFIVSGITTNQGKVDPSSTSKNIIVNVGDIPASGTVTIKIPATVIL